jgi:hypothetical protein
VLSKFVLLGSFVVTYVVGGFVWLVENSIEGFE